MADKQIVPQNITRYFCYVCGKPHYSDEGGLVYARHLLYQKAESFITGPQAQKGRKDD